MGNVNYIDASRICPVLSTVTVTYNPCLEELTTQLDTIPSESIKIIVDNASDIRLFKKLEELAGQYENLYVIRNERNLGLAAAINLGVRQLTKMPTPPEFVLLLDQDSEPQKVSIGRLLDAFHTLQATGHRVGCVGPLLWDADTGLTHGFHRSRGLRWERIYPELNSPEPVPCTNLNGSGTLVPLKIFQELGGLDESLFIDHVDTEWAFRVLANGYTLWGVPNAVFKHSMGQQSARIWLLGWRIWPVRSPLRHYYLYRNAVMLMRRSYVPAVWKFWAVIKLMLTVVVTVYTGPSRWEQIKCMWRGVMQSNGCR